MKNTKKILVAALALVLCLTVSVGATLAYFTDTTSAKGMVTVGIGGKTEINETIAENGTKTAVIANTGDTDVFVRVSVAGDKAQAASGSGWTNGGDGYYYYGSVVPVGGETSALVIPVDISGTEDFSVAVIQECTQAAYDDAGVAYPIGWAN